MKYHSFLACDTGGEFKGVRVYLFLESDTCADRTFLVFVQRTNMGVSRGPCNGAGLYILANYMPKSIRF